MSMLSEMGIQCGRGQTNRKEPEEAATTEEPTKAEAYSGGNIDEDDVGRTDDPGAHVPAVKWVPLNCCRAKAKFAHRQTHQRPAAR